MQSSFVFDVVFHGPHSESGSTDILQMEWMVWLVKLDAPIIHPDTYPTDNPETLMLGAYKAN